MTLRAALGLLIAVFWASSIAAQQPLPAVDVTAAQIKTFISALPPNVVSDKPIRVVDARTHNVGIFAVRRPQNLPGDAIVHEVPNSEIYYVLSGSGTLVTGGTLINRTHRESDGDGTFRGSRIEGGVSRRVGVGDVAVIPPGTPHWWSSLDSELTYLDIRPDPGRREPLR